MDHTDLFSALPGYMHSEAPDEQDALGEIRALLSKPPSAEVWEAIWSCLQGIPEEPLIDTYAPYIIDHFTHWPDGLRAVPNALKPLFFSSNVLHQTKAQKPRNQALLSLVDTLELSPHQTFTSEHLSYLANNPLSRSLTTLQVYPNKLTLESWQAFTESRELLQLRALSLHSFQFTSKSLESLCAARWSSQLRSLQLAHCNALDAPDAELALHMPRLTHLSLFGSHIDAIIISLLNAPTLPPITHLSIKNDLPTPEVLQPLLQAIAPRSLQSIQADSYGLDARELLPLLHASGPYPHLSTLRLEGIRGVQLASQEFLSSDLCPALQELELSQLALGANLIDILEASHFPGQLRSLSIQFDDLGEQGLTRLARLPQLASLEHLQLRGTLPSTRGLETLFREPSFVGLQTLDLRGNKIGKQRGQCMGQPHALQALEQLDVSQNPLGDKLVISILMNPSTPHLHTFSCQQCTMSIPGVYAFLTTSEVPQSLREKALLEILEQCDREGLRELIEMFGIKAKKNARKAQMLKALRAHITTKEALEAFLCHEAFTKQLNGQATKATLRALGVKDYNGLRAEDLRIRLRSHLNTSQDVLAEAAATILKERREAQGILLL